MLYTQPLQRATKRLRISDSSQDDGRPHYVATSYQVGKQPTLESFGVIGVQTLCDMRSDSFEVAIAAMWKLLKRYDQPFRSKSKRCEELTTIIFAMERWPESETLQGCGCALLERLLCDMNADTTALTASSLVPWEDTLSAILVAMDTHTRTWQVQFHGCAALCLLFAGRDRTIGHCGVRFVKPKGGLHLVMRAMDHFRYDAAVQRAGLGLLQNLFVQPLCGIPIRVSGAITTVAKAIDSHHANADIQVIGHKVMKHFFP